MFRIVYEPKTGNTQGFMHLWPGHQSYICFNQRFQGNTDWLLGALIRFMDTSRALTKRQKLQDRVLFLEEIPNPVHSPQVQGKPIRYTNTQEADFCLN